MSVDSFVLVNNSQSVSDEQLSTIAHAIELYMNTRFCQAWGVAGVRVLAVSKGDLRGFSPESIVVNIEENDDSVPDAFGWHQAEELHDSKADAFVVVSTVLDNGGGIFDGGKSNVSVASVIDHEVKETKIDKYCNLWTMMPDGKFICYEVCDPCQGMMVPQSSKNTRVWLSDAVRPAYFDATALNVPLTMANSIKVPFACGNGGYQILFDPKTNEYSNVFGSEIPDWRKAKADCRDGKHNRGSKRRIANWSIPGIPRASHAQAT